MREHGHAGWRDGDEGSWLCRLECSVGASEEALGCADYSVGGGRGCEAGVLRERRVWWDDRVEF